MHRLNDRSGRTVELIDERGEDRDFLAALYASTRLDELAALPWSQTQKRAFLQQQFEAQDAHYRQHYADTQRHIIHVDGQPAGRLYRQYRAAETRIVDIALMPAYRQQGIGQALLEAELDRAAQQGRRVGIHVEKNNPAYRLYTRLGFRQSEDKGVYDFLEWSVSTARHSTQKGHEHA